MEKKKLLAPRLRGLGTGTKMEIVKELLNDILESQEKEPNPVLAGMASARIADRLDEFQMRFASQSKKFVKIAQDQDLEKE